MSFNFGNMNFGGNFDSSKNTFRENTIFGPSSNSPFDKIDPNRGNPAFVGTLEKKNRVPVGCDFNTSIAGGYGGESMKKLAGGSKFESTVTTPDGVGFTGAFGHMTMNGKHAFATGGGVSGKVGNSTTLGVGGSAVFADGLKNTSAGIKGKINF